MLCIAYGGANRIHNFLWTRSSLGGDHVELRSKQPLPIRLLTN